MTKKTSLELESPLFPSCSLHLMSQHFYLNLWEQLIWNIRLRVAEQLVSHGAESRPRYFLRLRCAETAWHVEGVNRVRGALRCGLLIVKWETLNDLERLEPRRCLQNQDACVVCDSDVRYSSLYIYLWQTSAVQCWFPPFQEQLNNKWVNM